MARKRAAFFWVMLVSLVLIAYLVLVKPRRFIQCLPAPIQYLTRDYGTGQNASLPMPSTGNSVRLLVNGDETLPAMLALIDSAQASIRWQVMLFQPDEAGSALADALVRAARRDVKVQLSFNIEQTINGTIEDRFTAEVKARNQRQMTPLLTNLHEAGVEVRENRPGIDFPLLGIDSTASAIQADIQRNACISANHYDHRKLLVVDGRQAWIGGMNVGRRYLFFVPPNPVVDSTVEATQREQAGLPEAWEKWFDASAIVDGPLVTEMVDAFNWRWMVLGGQPLPDDSTAGRPNPSGSANIQLLQQRPGDPQIGARFFDLVNSAQHEIMVASPFVSYDPALRALEAASRRGVRVVFVYPNAKQESGVSGRVFRGSVNELVEAGVELNFDNLRMAHTKLMVVDGGQVLIGSFNLNHRSFRHDLEIAALVDDPAFAQQVIDRVFTPYLQISERVREPIHAPWNLINWIIRPFT